MEKCSPRLKLMHGLLEGYSAVADIGSDHGKLACALLTSGTARVIATDISADSLGKARVRARRLGLEDRLEFRLGDGLSPLEGERVDAVVIAGLGGEMIAGILERGEEVARRAKKLLFQPMSAPGYLRRYLLGHGYRLLDEHLVRDAGRIYQVIEAAAGQMEQPPWWPADFFEIGWLSWEKQDPLFEPVLERLLRIHTRALTAAGGQSGELHTLVSQLMAVRELGNAMIKPPQTEA